MPPMDHAACGIVSKSPEGLPINKVMVVIVRVCRALWSDHIREGDGDRCARVHRKTTQSRSASMQRDKSTIRRHCSRPRGEVDELACTTGEMTRHIGLAWGTVRNNSQQLYDHGASTIRPTSECSRLKKWRWLHDADLLQGPIIHPAQPYPPQAADAHHLFM